MIYLIGGPPRVGKSSVASALAFRLACSWCPTDYLASTVNPYSHGPEGAARPGRLGGDIDNDERYARFPTAQILANYRERARYNSLGILEGFVEYAASDNRDFVVEGFHLEPAPMVAARDRWPDRIRALLLVRMDPRSIAGSLASTRDPNDWVFRTVRQPETFERMAELVVTYSRALVEGADRVGCPVLDTAQASLVDSVSRAIKLLMGDDGPEEPPGKAAG